MRERGERSIVAIAAVAALRCLARLEGRRRQQCAVGYVRRQHYLRTFPAALRRGREELAACRYLRLESDEEAGTPGRRRMPGGASDLQIARGTLWMIRG